MQVLDELVSSGHAAIICPISLNAKRITLWIECFIKFLIEFSTKYTISISLPSLSRSGTSVSKRHAYFTS